MLTPEDEVQHLRRLILWADDVSSSCCDCLRMSSEAAAYEEWKRAVERIEKAK